MTIFLRLIPVWNRIKALALRSRLERDLEEELRFHIGMGTEANPRRGLAPPEAVSAARRQFGNSRRIRDSCRDLRRFLSFEALLQDARFGLRMLLRHPGFTLAALAILGVGIGVNTSLFTMTNALLLRPISGVKVPEELVQIGRTELGQGFDTLSYPEFVDLQTRTASFSGVAAHSPVELTIRTQSVTERVDGEAVSTNFFQLLGVEMALGTGFTSEDDRLGETRPVALVSHRLWRRLFTSDPGIVGRYIIVNRHPVSIKGVVSPHFRSLSPAHTVDVWIPLSLQAFLKPGDDLWGNRVACWLNIVARRKTDASERRARAEIEALGAGFQAQYPELGDRGLAVVPGVGWDPKTRHQALQIATVLFSVTAVVLVIACFNVANLLLARASVRSREVAVRLAIGSGRSRIVRQTLVEAAQLALAGGGLSLGFAFWTSRLVDAFAPEGVSIDGFMDSNVIAVAFGLSLAASLVLGLPPALQASRRDVAGELKESATTGTSCKAPLRSVFVVTQLALSFTLAVAAGLLVRTLVNSQHVDLGFTPRGLLAAYYDLESNGYDDSRGREFHRRLLERIRSIPGVQSAALGRTIPLQGTSMGMPLRIEGQPDDPTRPQLVRVNVVSADYFRTLQTPVRAGREFTSADRTTTTPVAVINEACARRFFGNADPLRRRLRMFREDSAREIVGVVGDSKYASPIEEVHPTVFLPLEQQYWSRVAIHVRSSNPDTVAQAVRAEIRAMDGDLPLYGMVELARQFEIALSQPRWIAAMVSGFSAIALMLGVLGLYGILSYGVAQRTREIAIRLALGAAPSTVARLVMTWGIRLAAIGCAIGFGCSLLVAQLLKAQLYGVSPADPVTFAVVSLMLFLAAAGACAAPAWRAMRVNAVTSLKSQ
jgi:predicted permease